MARWRNTATQRLLTIENSFYRVELWPEQGGAITSYLHKAENLDVIWRNPLLPPARRHFLAQPMGPGTDLFDTMDGSWYVSLPNGFFAGDYFGAPVGTHGELRAVPWVVETIRSTRSELTVTLRGASVRTPLVYRRELTVKAGSALMDWRETVENRSAEPLPVAWLQHPTFGGALLHGARLVTPAKTVQVFRGDHPEAIQLQAGYSGQWPFVPERVGGALRDCSIVPAEKSGLDHSVQLGDFSAGWGCIWNEARSLGFSMQWDLDVFPYAWSWASGGGARHYPLWGEGHLITLQPSTSPVGRFPDLVSLNAVRVIPGQGEVTATMRTGFVQRAEGPWA
ncbi:MAG: hypothetical protein JWM32_318 [Verrucomicrobia bacterium]|nr:hypothetical protein [Verrucomicrobiota bacterium]